MFARRQEGSLVLVDYHQDGMMAIRTTFEPPYDDPCSWDEEEFVTMEQDLKQRKKRTAG